MNNGQEEIYQLKQRVRELELAVKAVQNAFVSALEKAQEEVRHWNSVATKLLNPL